MISVWKLVAWLPAAKAGNATHPLRLRVRCRRRRRLGRRLGRGRRVRLVRVDVLAVGLRSG